MVSFIYAMDVDTTVIYEVFSLFTVEAPNSTALPFELISTGICTMQKQPRADVPKT